ncbi:MULTISPECIES: hypothetical protein [unclassified Bartonella]|uniref:hypothetical protein n=1 Tax=unclassified Bartonella TaxID=2645622 RepID=UPI0035CEA4DA
MAVWGLYLQELIILGWHVQIRAVRYVWDVRDVLGERANTVTRALGCSALYEGKLCRVFIEATSCGRV